MRSQRGFVYITSLVFVVFLTVVGASMLVRSVSESSLSQRFDDQLVAFHLADAGIDQAARNLRTPTDTSDDITTGTLPTGTFTVDAPQSLGPLSWRAISHGYSAQDAAHLRHIEAVFQLTPKSVFQYALFGDQNITAGGSANTDSYDSRLGAYGACLSDCGGGSPVTNDGNNGDIGTNATTAGGVTVSGSLFVDGQVAVGSGVSNPTSVVTGYDPTMISGDPKVVAQDATFPMTAVPPMPSGLTCSDRTITGNTTVALSTGTYCYGDLTIQGGGTLTTDGSGPVTVYLTGALTAQGNSSVGVASNPTLMRFLMPGTTAATIEEGTMTGSTQFYGALYGPNSTINITGNAEVYGSVVAKRVNLTGSAAIHYDEAMSTITDISNLYQTSVVSWREVEPE